MSIEDWLLLGVYISVGFSAIALLTRGFTRTARSWIAVGAMALFANFAAAIVVSVSSSIDLMQIVPAVLFSSFATALGYWYGTRPRGI